MKRILLSLALATVVLSVAAQTTGNEYLFIKFDDSSRNVEVFRADRDVERLSMNQENRGNRDADLRYVLTLIEKLETEGWVLIFSNADHTEGRAAADRDYFWTMRKPKQ